MTKTYTVATMSKNQIHRALDQKVGYIGGLAWIRRNKAEKTWEVKVHATEAVHEQIATALS